MKQLQSFGIGAKRHQAEQLTEKRRSNYGKLAN